MDTPADTRVVVCGIGADGWDGLSMAGRRALEAAEVILGAPRQLDLLPDLVRADRRAWPSPLLPALPALLAEHAGSRLVVLASGDPLFFGVGTSIVRELGPDRVDVISHPSSVNLAGARLGWAGEDVDVVSVVGRPMALLHPYLQPGRRILLLLAEPHSAASVATRLTELGFGPSALTRLSRLGGTDEVIVRGTASTWSVAGDDALAILGVEVRAAAGTRALSLVPGLDDDEFEHDGQLTKREVRALTLSTLGPLSGELLWDIGAGSGSIGIEWMRVHRANRAIAIERSPERIERISANAERLGVPGLQIVSGSAPEVLDGLARPDAVFVGGAVSVPGVIEGALAALGPNGRLVANGVTVETETVLAGWHGRLGGRLTRLAVTRAAPVGGFTGWRPAMPVTQWSYRG